jgi:hypothetical protein
VRAALENDPEKACQDLTMILRKIAIHENISPAGNWAVVLKG